MLDLHSSQLMFEGLLEDIGIAGCRSIVCLGCDPYWMASAGKATLAGSEGGLCLQQQQASSESCMLAWRGCCLNWLAKRRDYLGMCDLKPHQKDLDIC